MNYDEVCRSTMKLRNGMKYDEIWCIMMYYDELWRSCKPVKDHQRASNNYEKPTSSNFQSMFIKFHETSQDILKEDSNMMQNDAMLNASATPTLDGDFHVSPHTSPHQGATVEIASEVWHIFGRVGCGSVFLHTWEGGATKCIQMLPLPISSFLMFSYVFHCFPLFPCFWILDVVLWDRLKMFQKNIKKSHVSWCFLMFFLIWHIGHHHVVSFGPL